MKLPLTAMLVLVSCQNQGNSKVVFNETDLSGCDEVHLFAPLRCLPESTFEGCTESLIKEVENLGATTLLLNQTKDSFQASEILGRAFNCPKK